MTIITIRVIVVIVVIVVIIIIVHVVGGDTDCFFQIQVFHSLVGVVSVAVVVYGFAILDDSLC